MDKINKPDINFLNIIFLKDFIQYLELDLLKEISLLSNIVREKLKPRLFTSLRLSTKNYKFNFIDNVFIDLIDYYIYPKSKIRLFKDIEPLLTSSSISSSLNDYNSSLKNIQKFVTRFHLDEMLRCEFYLITVACNFFNLSSLTLNSCYVPLVEFYKLIESLQNLKSINLKTVIFKKLPKDEIDPKNIKFPPKLAFISIRRCKVFNSEPVLDPIKLILNGDPTVEENGYTLPNISVPSLKEIFLIENDINSTGIGSFLEINPNLYKLRIDKFNLNVISKLNTLHSLEFNLIEGINISYQIPILISIKNLKICSVYLKYFKNIESLCLLCPNLEKIHFIMVYNTRYDHVINQFLAPMLPNLCQLKTLELLLKTEEDEIWDITKLSNIESIIIKTESSTIFNLNFYQCKNLKKVEFISYTNKVNTKEFKEKFNGYKNWVFKFNNNTIRGYKLSQ